MIYIAYAPLYKLPLPAGPPRGNEPGEPQTILLRLIATRSGWLWRSFRNFGKKTDNMPTWFQGTIKYQKEEIITDRQGDQVRLKTITEAYLVDAVSYTDAEARLYQEVPANSPDFQVARISKMKLADVFQIENGGDYWYKAKVIFSTEDDKGREKKIVNQMLINAFSVKQAYEQLEDSLKTILMPSEITDINKTPLLDIFPYSEEEKIPANLKPMSEVARMEEV